MKTPEFRNTSKLEFTSIDSEEYREYVFAGGEIIKIDNPLRLHVSSTGGHRVFDAQEMSHYIPKGWIHLRWKTKAGQPHFVK